MKKVLFSAVLLVFLVMVIMGADFRRTSDEADSRTGVKPCVGYTIIAFDKGVDCHGDTITLVRRSGHRERVNTTVH